MFLVLVAAVAAVLVMLWMDRRRAADFRAQLAELHQERSRFWRACLQRAEPGEDGPELSMRAHRHLARVRALADALHARHRVAAAASWISEPAFTRELRDMDDALTGAVPREAAAERVEHARRAAEALRGPAGYRMEGAALRHGAVGAVLGACTGFLIPYWFAMGFYLEDSASPLAEWTLGGAVVGFMLGALGGEAFWDWMLPADAGRGRSLARVLGPTLAVVAVVVVAYAIWYGPPSGARQERVMEEMVARTGCPRLLPPVLMDSTPGLSPVQRCAVLRTAARALPPTPVVRRFVEAGDTAGVVVTYARDFSATNPIHVAPGWGVNGRNLFGWAVAFSVSGERGGIYTVFVDRRTGRATLEQQTLHSEH